LKYDFTERITLINEAIENNAKFLTQIVAPYTKYVSELE